MIATWWASLSLIMKIVWGVTLVATLVFLIQSVMTFIGADVDSDFSTDVDIAADGSDLSNIDAGTNLYTFRNFVNFFMGFGWSVIILQDSISSTFVLVLVSLLIGIALVALVMYLFKWLSSMQQSGNIDVKESAAGWEGKVYLSIPGQRQGSGKVQINIDGAVREYDAVTDSAALPTGASIRVVEAIDSNTLLVEEISTYIV